MFYRRVDCSRSLPGRDMCRAASPFYLYVDKFWFSELIGAKHRQRCGCAKTTLHAGRIHVCFFSIVCILRYMWVACLCVWLSDFTKTGNGFCRCCSCSLTSDGRNDLSSTVVLVARWSCIGARVQPLREEQVVLRAVVLFGNWFGSTASMGLDSK